MTIQPGLDAAGVYGYERRHTMSEIASNRGAPAGSALLWRSALVAALGGLLFGFDTAVISGTTAALEAVYGLSKFQLGFTVASALIGTIVGSLIAGNPADRFGRRACLFAIAVLYFVSAVGTALAWDWWSFLFMRFIGGIGVGAASVIAPMYIAEISPAAWRGRLVALTQFNIVFGILVAFFSNYIVATLDLGATEWRWMFGIEAFPAAVFFLLLFSVPESPRWLVAGRQDAAAESILIRLGNDGAQVRAQMDEIRNSLDLEHHSLREPFFRRAYRAPILLAVAIAMFNQLSGINALMYYAPHIFRMAGAGEGSALLQTVAVGGTNLLFTMAALAIIDHFGRRRLMIVGSLGYILSLGVTAWAFYTYNTEFREVIRATDAVATIQEGLAGQPAEAARANLETELSGARSALDTATAAAATGGTVVLVSLLVFIASHAFGQGAVIWVFISEVFPNRVRARGQALGSFTHWIMAAAISWTFPMIAAWSGAHTFAFYAAMMVLQLVWVLRVMPETKGVPLEEIQRQMGIK